MRRNLLSLVGAALLAASSAKGAPEALVLDGAIPLPNTSGRIDHLAVDLARKHLFVAELGNGTVDVVDLTTRKVVHRISGLDEPQGVAYDRLNDRVIVACGGDGIVRSYDGGDFSPRAMVDLGDDADNVRIDPRDNSVLVGYGDGGIAVLSTPKLTKIAHTALPAHPEGFQVSPSAARVFVNVPDARQIDVIDTQTHKLIAAWTAPGLSANFPMALVGSGVVAVAFRSPARLAAFDAASGAPKFDTPTCGDADDVFFDAKRNRIYVSCGAGAIDVFEQSDAGLRRLASVPSASGARTSLFVPELDRLFVAARAGWLGTDASVQVYRPNP